MPRKRLSLLLMVGLFVDLLIGSAIPMVRAEADESERKVLDTTFSALARINKPDPRVCSTQPESSAGAEAPPTGEFISPAEAELIQRLNDYRVSRGLPRIALSKSLTKVAQTHARDMSCNYDTGNIARCNLHSWSDKGNWGSCCYTADHAQASCMWNKPKEIAGYTGSGYEIAAFGIPAHSPKELIEDWKKSPGHHAMMINGKYRSVDWSEAMFKAVGVGIHGNFATIWFGEEADPASPSVHDPRF